jgi:hypothetical protein
MPTTTLTEDITILLAEIETVEGAFTGRTDPLMTAYDADTKLQEACKKYLAATADTSGTNESTIATTQTPQSDHESHIIVNHTIMAECHGIEHKANANTLAKAYNHCHRAMTDGTEVTEASEDKSSTGTKVVIEVANKEQAAHVVEALSVAEEELVLGFPFNCAIVE